LSILDLLSLLWLYHCIQKCTVNPWLRPWKVLTPCQQLTTSLKNILPLLTADYIPKKSIHSFPLLTTSLQKVSTLCHCWLHPWKVSTPCHCWLHPWKVSTPLAISWLSILSLLTADCIPKKYQLLATDDYIPEKYPLLATSYQSWLRRWKVSTICHPLVITTADYVHEKYPRLATPYQRWLCPWKVSTPCHS
jgi:hypothetical protein